MRFLMGLVLCIVSGFLYRLGGSDKPYTWKKFFNYRSMIGIPIGISFALWNHSFVPLLCIVTYWFQPPYGEKSYLNVLGEWGKFAVCGFIFGISSFFAIGLWAILQGLISAGAYVGIKYLDDKNIIKNPWVERLRGWLGTCLI